MKNIFFLVGENSADLHAAEVIKYLIKNESDLKLWGIGGPRMQKLGFESLFPFEKFSMIGFVEVLQHISFYYTVRQRIKNEFKRRKPDLVILVDYPGLNLKIARLAFSLKIPVLYYICPQIWAWNKNRIYAIKNYTTKLAVIFPFEKKLYEKVGSDVEFVGNPITDELKFTYSKNNFTEKYKLDKNKKWLAFLPGSRDIEIKRMLPLIVKTIIKLKKSNLPIYEFLISCPHTISQDKFYNIIEPIKDNVKIVKEIYDLMKYSDFVICKSGTSSLETAYIGTPLIVIYKVSFLTYIIAKFLIEIEIIAMPNIILGSKKIPELIQNKATPENIIKQINSILYNKNNKVEMKKNLNLLKRKLTSKKASYNVARIVLEMIYEPKNIR